MCEEYRNGLGFMLFEQIASEMLCLVDHPEIVDPHVIGFLDIESVDLVDDEALAPAWPFVVDTVFVEGRVVKVERDSCGGCHAKIPAQSQLDIRARKKIIPCEFCGRILVDPEM